MDAQTGATEFFRAGGTLHPGAPSYVSRPADAELFERIMAGQFCYVLTSRQRGKSSLMIRTAERLRQAGITTAIIDLSGLGTQLTREQWYLGIIKRLAHDLRLTLDPEQWWRERAALGPVQCFTDFLHDVALAGVTGRIVIFIDEIDSTLKLGFTDDFFAAIRLMYNQRASDPAYDRLTFVLLGVAAPADLIKDRKRTPFNVGNAIDLADLSRADARPLEDGLEQHCPGQGCAILDRIFYWTNGHPYLTQKLCQEIAESPENSWPDTQVDTLVKRLFLAEEAGKEDNLQFVRNMVAATPERGQLLKLYQRIHIGQEVVADDRSSFQNRLRLIGLVRAEGGKLRVSNAIYQHVFDPPWIKAQIPLDRTRRITIGAVVLSVVALIVLFLVPPLQRQLTVAGYKNNFRTLTVANTKMRILAQLCQIDSSEGQKLFFEQNQAAQWDMFESATFIAGGHVLTVAGCLAPALTGESGEDDRGRLLVPVICRALDKTYGVDPEPIRKRFDCHGARKGEP